MTLDEIKKCQTFLGVSIEVVQSEKLPIIEQALNRAMKMSIDYEKLVRQVHYFTTQLDPSHPEISKL